MKSSNKLFTCETCDKTFVKASDLSRHKKMTTTHDLTIKNTNNGTVFVCDVCRKEFKDAQYLFAHSSARCWSICDSDNYLGV